MAAAGDGARGYRHYWDEARETMPAAERRVLILARIQHQLAYAYHRIPFYRTLYDRHGFKPEDVRHLEDFTAKVPVVTKGMLRASQEAHPPFGDYLGIDEADIMRIQGTSGTTGQPTLFAISRADWAHISEAQAMQCWAAGMRPHDTVQVAFPLSLFVGGWGLLGAAERIGAKVLPVGGGESERQLLLMKRLGASVICATPSFALHLHEVARSLGDDPAASSLRLGFFGGEPGAGIPAVKRRIEEGWGLLAIDFGNVAEVHPCTNMECAHRTGMHAYIDIDYTEVVRPEAPNEAVSMGRRGAVVYTQLWRESQPMIRYFPGDETEMTDAPCACGRTYPRLPRGIIGRLDDLLIIRGAKVYPSAVEAVLRDVPGAGTEFRILVDRPGALDEASVQLEAEGMPASVRERAEARLKASLGIRVPVELVTPGTFERTAFKARRVIDRRPPLDQLPLDQPMEEAS